MHKFDGLDIETKYEENLEENFFDVQSSEEFETNTLKTLEIKPQKNRYKFFFAFLMIVGTIFIVSSIYLGNFKEIKLFLQNEYNYKHKELISSSEFVDNFCEFFNISQKVNTSQIKQIEIKKPFIAVDILVDDGEIVFKNIESVFLKAGVNGRVVKIDNTLGGRRVEILCDNGCILIYKGLTYIGTQINKTLKIGDLFGAANGDVVLSLFYKNNKLNLNLDEQGNIIWES